MTSIALFGISHKIETFKESLFFLMQNKAKVVAARFLVRIAGPLHRPERRYRLFFYKRQSLKARIHETEGIFVDFIVR